MANKLLNILKAASAKKWHKTPQASQQNVLPAKAGKGYT